MEFPVHIMLHLVSEPRSCIHRKHHPIKTRVFYFSSWVLLFSQCHAFIHILCLFKNVVPQPSQWRSEPDSCRWKYIPTGLQPPMTLRQTSRPNGRWVFVFAAHLFLLDFINNVFVIYSSSVWTNVLSFPPSFSLPPSLDVCRTEAQQRQHVGQVFRQRYERRVGDLPCQQCLPPQ